MPVEGRTSAVWGQPRLTEYLRWKRLARLEILVIQKELKEKRAEQRSLKQLLASDRVQRPVDLVLWPEDVIDTDRVAGSPEDRALAGLARRLDATVVAGIVEDAGPDHFANAALAWGPDGRRVARYDKVHRVPFGEYIPLRSLVRHFADLSAVPRDALAGTGPGVLRTPAVSVTAPGRLDIQDNKLITATAVGTAAAGVYDGVRQRMLFGFGNTAARGFADLWELDL